MNAAAQQIRESAQVLAVLLRFDRWGRPLVCLRAGCGRPIVQPPLGRPRHSCSPECARELHNASRRVPR